MSHLELPLRGSQLDLLVCNSCFVLLQLLQCLFRGLLLLAYLLELQKHIQLLFTFRLDVLAPVD